MMNPLKLFRHWLDGWWREHHPAGGGSPPTLEETFAAGMKAGMTILKAARSLAYEIDRLTGKDDHPEHRCERCGGRNIVWYADNAVWNKIVRAHFEKEPMLCPLCLAELAEEQGDAPTAWRLSREGDLPEVDLLRTELHHLQSAVAHMPVGGDKKPLWVGKESVWTNYGGYVLRWKVIAVEVNCVRLSGSAADNSLHKFIEVFSSLEAAEKG